MLNHVSNLVNLRNAKKLAQNGASQMDLSEIIHQGEVASNSPKSKSPHTPGKAIFGLSRSRVNKTDVEMRAGAREGQSVQATSGIDSTSGQTHHVPQDSNFGSGRSKTEGTDVGMRAGAREGQSTQTSSEVEGAFGQSPHVPRDSTFGSDRSKTDKTDVGMRAGAREGQSAQTSSEVEGTFGQSPHVPRNSIFGSGGRKTDKTVVERRTGASESQSAPTTSDVETISRQSPHIPWESNLGSGPSQSVQTAVKMKIGACGDPCPQIMGTNESLKVDSCSSAKSLDANPIQTPLIKRIVRSDGFYLEAKVNQEKMVFTVDTGASRTIISERVYKAIPLANRPMLSKTAALTEASGQPLSQLGTAEVTITLDGIQFQADIIVANIEDDGLFGHDLLIMGDAHLLYDEHALTFMGVHIPCIKVGSTPRIRRITAADHFVVPAYSEKIIDVFVSRLIGDDQQDTPVVLEPSAEFHEQYDLVMASSLSSLNSRVTHKVRLLNPNMYDISINQDASIGTAEDIDGFTLLSSESTLQPLYEDHKATTHPVPENINSGVKCVTEEIVPEHLRNLYETACIDRTEAEKCRIAQTLIKFQDSFSKHEFDLGLTNLVEHSIDVGSHPPIKQAPRRVPVAFASEEENVIKQMEAQGIIRKSTSP